MNLRLRSTMARPPDFFGGINILLCGDSAQLPPVEDTASYALPAATKSSVEVMAGKSAYDTFAEIIALSETMRQQSHSPSACQFRQTLSELRDRPLSRENREFLLSRISEHLDVQVRTEFNEAFYIYGTIKRIADHNPFHVEQLRMALAVIHRTRFKIHSIASILVLCNPGYYPKSVSWANAVMRLPLPSKER